MSSYIYAVTFGVCLGALACVVGNKATSDWATAQCFNKPTHQVVYTSTFLGDTYSCVDKRYLNI